MCKEGSLLYLLGTTHRDHIVVWIHCEGHEEIQRRLLHSHLSLGEISYSWFSLHSPSCWTTLSSLYRARLAFCWRFVLSQSWSGFVAISHKAGGRRKSFRVELLQMCLVGRWLYSLNWISASAWGFPADARTDKKRGQAEDLMSSMAVCGQRRLLPFGNAILLYHSLSLRCDIFPKCSIHGESNAARFWEVEGSSSLFHAHEKKKLFTDSNQVKARNWMSCLHFDTLLGIPW